MATNASFNKAFELPKLRKILKTSLDNPDSEANHFWDAKFYPFDHNREAPPVFALNNKKNIMVCRMSSQEDNDIEVIRVFAIKGEDHFGEHYCSCTWAFIDPNEPLILGAGEAGVVRVYDVVHGTLKTSLLGHGQGIINDLATHPKYPWIVASASQDTSIRIWDLRRWNDKQESPCIAICGHGNGHRETLLSISWHDSGRYIISGAHDHRICVWTVPDLSPESIFWEEISPSQRKRSSDEVKVIHYPHFVTSALHTNFVDCVRWYGDLVMSKSAEENKIVLWSITGFNSHCEPPDAILAPKTQEHLDTRNGFTRTFTIDDNGAQNIEIAEIYSTKLPYTRLLEFQVPSCKPFFIRFDLLKPSPTYPDLHPILAIGNTQSTVYFWDLEAIEIGYNPLTLTRPPKKKKYTSLPKKGIATPIERGRLNTQKSMASSSGPASTPSSSRDRSLSLQRTPSMQRAASSETGATSDLFSLSMDPSDPTQQVLPEERDRERYPLHLPRKPLEHTKMVKMTDFTRAVFTARGVGWSPDGRWCVVAGETAERNVGVAFKTLGLKEEFGETKGVGSGKRKSGGVGKGRKGEGDGVLVGAACVFGRW